MKPTSVICTIAMMSGCVGLTAGSDEGTAGTGIVGGGGLRPEQAPYVVALTENGLTFCSGTLVSNRVVVTAANCLVSRDPTKIDVVVGNAVKDGTVVGVEAGHLHPFFDWTASPQNDIAVLILAEEVTFTTGPAKILEGGPDWSEAEEQTFYMVGFGSTSGEKSDVGGVKNVWLTPLYEHNAWEFRLVAWLTDGDTGGPSFLRIDGILYFVGLHSRVTERVQSIQVRVDAYWQDFVLPYVRGDEDAGGGADPGGDDSAGGDAAGS